MSMIDIMYAKKFIGGGSEWDRNFTIGEVPPLPPSSGGGIIEVDVLPTENINENAFYFCNGGYYKWEKSNVWVFNDELTLDDSINCNFTFEFDGCDDTKNGTAIKFGSYGGTNAAHIKYGTDLTESWGSPKEIPVYAYDESFSGTVGWQKEEYKTIEILEMPTDETFLAWLKANATLCVGWKKYLAPVGAMKITENGKYDVTSLSAVNVDVDVDVPAPTNLVIEVDELPEDSDVNLDAVYSYNGDLYKYSTYDIWKFNDEITIDTSLNCEFAFEFEGYEVSRVGTAIKHESYGPPGAYSMDYVTNAIRDSGTMEHFTASAYIHNPSGNYGVSHGWTKEEYKTIKILEMPTDENFLTWLYANATCIVALGWNKYSTGGKVIEVTELPTEDIDTSAVYSYNGELYRYSTYSTFKDEITLDGLELNKHNQIEFTLADGTTFRSIRYRNLYNDIYALDYEVMPDGNSLGNVTVYRTGTFSGRPAGWDDAIYKTIYITSMPTDEAFLTWLDKNLAVKPGWTKYSSGSSSSTPQSYHVSSVDELPADAVDGSLAMAEVPDKMLGIWLLNDVVDMDFFSHNLEFTSNGNSYVYIATYGTLTYGVPDDDPVVAYSDGVWADESYRTITITDCGGDYDATGSSTSTCSSWLNKNGTQLEAGTHFELYSRENGEWIYKTRI